MAQARLNYEELVTSYWESLTTVLRGFVPTEAYPFLETWIHDEDDVASILNILEAAATGGIDRVSLRLGRASLARVDIERLLHETGKLGVVSWEQTEEGAELEIALRQVVSPLCEIGSRYRAALAAIVARVTHERPLRDAGQGVRIEASHDGVTLAAIVEAGTHVVTEAAHLGARTQVQRGLLEGLCRGIEGVPLLEAADHGTITLEHQLREPAEGRPVAGVVQPENADEAFLLPHTLIRSLMKAYRELTGYAARRNEYERPPSAEWQALGTEAAMQKISSALASSSWGRGLALVGLQNRRRVVVSFTDDADAASRPSRLLQIEGLLRKTVEPVLEVHLEPKRDELTIRLKKGVKL
jgi:hypothetical protein